MILSSVGVLYIFGYDFKSSNVMKRVFLALVVFLLFSSVKVYAQCTVEAFPDDTVFIYCGYSDTIALEAYGNSGNHVLNNDFNNGTVGPGWDGTLSVTFSNPCGPSPDGSIHMWMGDQTPQPRTLTTQAFDLSLGGDICFEMRYSIQADPAPCEGPDEPQEGVYLQYSINNGSTWVTIQYFDPNGGNDPLLTNWQQYCVNIPIAAQTNNTKIRWHQDATSGNEYDHWGLDNVSITLNDPTAVFTWLHNGFVGQTPPDVIVSNDSTFTVVYTNANGDSCRDTVFVESIPPRLSAQTIPDTSFCDNVGCVDLNGNASVVFAPDTILTFENNEAQPIATISIPIPGAPPPTTAININVQGVSNNSISPVDIESVCINGLTYFGFDILTQTQVDISSLDISLVCPSGDTILLVPNGVTTGGNGLGYTNTCFVPAGSNIGTGTPPYSGNYQPSEPFTNLNGCEVNGIWEMLIENNSGVGFGQGIFLGWSITFHDPGIQQPATFSWAPTTNMTGANTLNPNVCPTESTTYTLTVSDSSNCASIAHDVTVGIVSSADLYFGGIVTDANCGEDNGEINLQPSGTSGAEQLNWSTGDDTHVVTGLSAGTYTVTLTDGCVIDTSFTVDGGSIFTIDADILGARCDSANGIVELTVTGNNGQLAYDWSNGESSNIADDLAEGIYTVTVSDSECDFDTTFTIDNIPMFSVDVAVDDENCSYQDGKIEVSVNSNNGTVVYDWEVGFDGSTLNGLDSGTYAITISDDLCSLDTMFTVAGGNGPEITISDTLQPSEGNADGEITVLANGGTSPWEYSINGSPFQSSNVFDNLEEGNYTVVVSDDNGCLDTLEIELTSEEELLIPSVFNPGSSIEDNAHFTIKGMVTPEVVIYNRWGKKIYESSAYKNDWDGENYKDGVYYYVAKDKGDGKEYSGFLHLIRD